MRTLREHLRIVFGMVQPETLIENMRSSSSKISLELNSVKIGKLSYRHFSKDILRNFTYEEVDILYENMKEKIEKRGASCGGESVFALLPEYTVSVLTNDGLTPVCRQNQLLNWRYCYLFLGQDLLITAHLAYVNACENQTTTNFTWPAQIKSDDRRLHEILNKGLAENHFHLNGSSRSFDLSWICLMNHPEHITRFFGGNGKKSSEQTFKELFEENLNIGVSLGINDNRLTWSKRLGIACWLRTKLFLWLQCEDINVACQNEGNGVEALMNYIDYDYSFHNLRSIVETARYRFGMARRFPQPNGKSRCLDYAITADVLECEDINNCCRSLVGERAFLYKALYCIYSGRLENPMQRKCFMDMFYLYILIKMQFRSELIQINQRYGFKNFAKYQDRKDIIFESFSEYMLEAKFLSVCESMKNGYVQSLEMRISPKSDAYKQKQKIWEIDASLYFLESRNSAKLTCQSNLLKDKGLKEKHFYVIHYPKLPKPYKPKDIDKERSTARARNFQMRRTTKTQAMELAYAMEKYDWLCTRIRGIDACTFEIGCRPEVFATEFRFLRHLSLIKQRDVFISGKPMQPKLSVTYHVGEDFMDIIDGLRAIDEAIVFLELESGERLGHAMALGVNAHDYYRLKHNRIVLTKQDYLDNIVWALNKTQALGIKLDSILKQNLENESERLIFEVYGAGFTMSDYFNSWHLRGDDPELYRFGEFNQENYNHKKAYIFNSVVRQYNTQRIMHPYRMNMLERFRNNSKAVELYSRYHFDHQVKSKGEKTEEIKIVDSYMEMVDSLQEKMMKEISQLKLGIETNPSSNVLIGPFDRYENHPIFRFYPVVPSTNQIVQYVSVNTDDQGVFDTSLAMEYSLLACAMHSMKSKDNNMIYNDDCIYDYLKRLRENGFSQTFPSTK